MPYIHGDFYLKCVFSEDEMEVQYFYIPLKILGKFSKHLLLRPWTLFLNGGRAARAWAEYMKTRLVRQLFAGI